VYFEVLFRSGKWEISAEDGLRLEARGVVRDRGVIRAAITVWQGEQLLLRDRVNLTSQQGRERFCRVLRDVCGVELDPRALLALDEAIRQTPQRRGREGELSSDDVAGKAPTLLELKDRIASHLAIADPDLIDVVLGAYAAHFLNDEPVWLLVVGPPSSAKSELIKLLYRAPKAYPLSSLTARTFASGLTAEGEEPSLLARLKDEVLLFKDFTTVLELHREERQALLAQLREIYDGRYDQTWGTGKELHWRGRLGFIAGVTPVIDSYSSVMSLLGPRFLLFRPTQPDRLQAGLRALANPTDWHDGVAREVGAFLRAVTERPSPGVAEEVARTIVAAADLVSRARSGVERDRWRRELDYAPEPEMPARLARQLHTLLKGVALVRGHAEATDQDLATVVRVALDCIPAVRRLCLAALACGEEDLTTSTLAMQTQYSTTTVRRALEDLQALGLVECDKQGLGLPDKWRLREEWRTVVETFLVPLGEEDEEARLERTLDAALTAYEQHLRGCSVCEPSRGRWCEEGRRVREAHYSTYLAYHRTRQAVNVQGTDDDEWEDIPF